MKIFSSLLPDKKLFILNTMKYRPLIAGYRKLVFSV